MVFADSGGGIVRIYVADDIHNYAGIRHFIVHIPIKYAVSGVFAIHFS